VTLQNKAFLKFYELKLSKQVLSGKPEEQCAFLALLFLARDEIATISKLVALHNYESPEEGPIRDGAYLTRTFLARTMSSKIFELIELVNGKSRWNKSSDPLICEFRAEALKRLGSFEHQNGYSIARNIRNSVGNHFSLKEAKKRWETVADDAQYYVYLHKTEGNSFSSFGNAICFDEYFRNKEPLDFGTWLDWSLEATRWSQWMAAEFLFRVFRDDSEAFIGAEKNYWVEPEFVGDLGKSTAPMFLRERRN